MEDKIKRDIHINFLFKNKAFDGIHAYALKILSNNDNFVNAFLFILNNCFFSGFVFKNIVGMYNIPSRLDKLNFIPG